MFEKIKLRHNSPEWLAFRKNGIGASDASAVLGMSNWTTNIELWEEKRGLRVPKDLSDSEVVKYGSEAEKYNVKLFALQYAERYKTRVDKTVVYLKNGFQFASLDGELEEIQTKHSVFTRAKRCLQRQISLGKSGENRFRKSITYNAYTKCW